MTFATLIKINNISRRLVWLALLLAVLCGTTWFSAHPHAAAAPVFTVTNTNDSGPGSLRGAILNANQSFGSTIAFNIPGAGVHTIAPLTPLPEIYNTTTIDGYTQPGAIANSQQVASNAWLLVELSGVNIAVPNANGLSIDGPNCVVRGLVINRFTGSGIFIQGPVGGALNGRATTIAGCFIGTNAAGTAALPNTTGIYLASSDINTIGGAALADRNLISGNTNYGIWFESAATKGNVVAGNLIGTDKSGSGALPNIEGVFINNGARQNIIGGVARNIISGNTDAGILITGSSQNIVTGNYVGLAAFGGSAVANNTGIRLTNGANNNQIGAVGAGGNVISGNGIGILANGGSTGTRIVNNLIGTRPDGVTALGNPIFGISLRTGGNNWIGDTVAGSGNTIAFSNTGVLVQNEVGDAIRQNSIFGNSQIGIDLDIVFPNPLVNPNDPGDADTGPNNLQNYPVINSVAANGQTQFSLDSLAGNTAYPVRVEFFANTACHAAGNGEGEKYLGFMSINAPGSYTANLTLAAGKPFITATATDANGNTSEFSACKAVSAVNIAISPVSLPNGTVGTAYSQALTATGGTAPYSFVITSGVPPTGLQLVSGGALTGIPTVSGVYPFTVKATDANGNFATQSYSVTINQGVPVSPKNLQFYPLAHPVRLLDTRVGQTGCDAPAAKITGGTSRTQTAAGRTCDGLTIPANAAALVGNATSVQSGGGSFTLYPSDIAKPNSANSNFAANQILNSLFTVRLGANDGAFKIFVSTDTDIVVDITGYYAPPSGTGLYFHPLPKPVRLLDTRAGASACYTPGLPLQGNTDRTQLGTTTCDNVLIPAGAQALTGNATTVSPQANGFLTLYPADAARPLIASANFQPGVNLNSPFMVGLSPSGEFNIYVASTTDLVVDVTGYYSTQLNDANGQGLLFNALSGPVRLLDTRAGQTGCYTPGTPMVGSSPYTQPATGACTGVPATAQAVVGNATTLNEAANGYLTFWPSDANQPFIATSNYRTGITFNRHFTTGLGADGAFKRYAASTTDLVVDLVGYFAP